IAVVTFPNSLNKSISPSPPSSFPTISHNIHNTPISPLYPFLHPTPISPPPSNNNLSSPSPHKLQPPTLLILNHLSPNLLLSTNTPPLSPLSPHSQI
ncbi:hypothetical protein, partial [Staphylococcus aureus]|uniref:hypothetical protein n=1 Tax=Staphylococcus aureus TaxID=1280 RepID=UPI001C92BF1A